VTRSSADVCLLRDKLTSLIEAIELSKECVKCIRGNLAWAFAYNGIGVALAAAGALHPSVAALLMVISSLVVLSRSMALGAVDKRPGNVAAGDPEVSLHKCSTESLAPGIDGSRMDRATLAGAVP
jgi:hypothetical protein